MLIKDIHINNRRGAIHVGANTGQELEWYTKMGFKRVMWFEPDPEVFEKLIKNLRSSRIINVAFNVGIHDELRSATLHVASNEGQSSSLLPFGKHQTYYPKIHYVKDIEVDLVRLDSVFGLEPNCIINDYNFLNIDTQGSELNVLKSLGPLLFKLDYVYCEVNYEELYKGCSLKGEIDSYLHNFGFTEKEHYRVKNYNWGDSLYEKSK